MKALNVGCVMLMALSTMSCATRANSVAPISISANEYSYLNCQDARAEWHAAQEKEFALTRRQNNAATADAASVFLFLLPLGSVFGADVSGELAQAKGESLALQRRASIACSETPAAAPGVAALAVAPATYAQPASTAPPPPAKRKRCPISSPDDPSAVSC